MYEELVNQPARGRYSQHHSSTWPKPKTKIITLALRPQPLDSFKNDFIGVYAIQYRFVEGKLSLS